MKHERERTGTILFVLLVLSILFLAGLLTFTNEDQINILMAGEASGGKSYLAIEITSYFPSGVPMLIGTASPAAFIHDLGEYDKETHIVRIDLRNRIIVLLDQPHYSLLQRLRALLSHDVKELQFKITDRTKSGAQRTKNVIIKGFPTFIFCSAKMSLEEQELTRCFILNPETSQEKLDESLRLLAAKVGNREAFRQWVENHPLRKLLRDRISAGRPWRSSDWNDTANMWMTAYFARWNRLKKGPQGPLSRNKVYW